MLGQSPYIDTTTPQNRVQNFRPYSPPQNERVSDYVKNRKPYDNVSMNYKPDHIRTSGGYGDYQHRYPEHLRYEGGHHRHEDVHHRYMEHKHLDHKPQVQRWSEYIPVKKTHLEWVAEQKTEYIPVEREHTDYMEIEHHIDYTPIKKYERKVEMIPVDRLQERTEYVPIHNTYINGRNMNQEYEHYSHNYHHNYHQHPPQNYYQDHMRTVENVRHDHARHHRNELDERIEGMSRSQYIAGQFSKQKQMMGSHVRQYNHPYNKY